MRAILSAPIAAAAMLVFMLAGSPARADQVYGNPQVNGATVDNCAVWGTDCGWGGAHQYCRTQGFAAARSFQLNNPGRTWVIGSQRYCDGAGCVGFSQVVCISASAPTGGDDTAFNAPQVNGAAVDNCAVWGTDCGWGGAHQYCRTQGYAAAKSWSLYNPGRTWVIGSQRFCEGGGCVGFSQVVCTRGGTAQPPPPPATGDALTGNWQGYCGTYQFQQSGNTFTWYCPSTQERGQGTINGNALSASWGGGAGTATGTITQRDASGRATRIEWSNGQVFTRN